MSGLKGMVKDGWNPKGKTGGKESWRGDFKGIGQVAGWMGKGKDPSQEASSHVSRPLGELKDPSSFGPPPKHINYHGAAAVPDRITPDTRGLGAPLSQAELRETAARQQAQAQAEEQQRQKPAPPPVPYRADTTGLTTNHLPKPPVRRDDSGQSTTAAPNSKPRLPPRLPPRTPSQNFETNPSPPPPTYEASQGGLNQGALGRLGRAGVSVPGLGIGGGESNPWKSESSHGASPVTRPGPQSPPMSELQSRFAKMSSPSSEEPPSQGTTFAQKQSAFKTAQSFRNDPSSVSLNDARSAASTANNFRERHGEQVASGVKTANGFNQKYGIANKISGYAGGSPSTPAAEAPPVASAVDSPALGKRKPPPPPPKRVDTSSSINRTPPPPPLPLGTKPR